MLIPFPAAFFWSHSAPPPHPSPPRRCRRRGPPSGSAAMVRRVHGQSARQRPRIALGDGCLRAGRAAPRGSCRV